MNILKNKTNSNPPPVTTFRNLLEQRYLTCFYFSTPFGHA